PLAGGFVSIWLALTDAAISPEAASSSRSSGSSTAAATWSMPAAFITAMSSAVTRCAFGNACRRRSWHGQGSRLPPGQRVWCRTSRCLFPHCFKPARTQRGDDLGEYCHGDLRRACSADLKPDRGMDTLNRGICNARLQQPLDATSVRL